MAIATENDYIAADKRIRPMWKTTSITTVAGGYFSMFDGPGALQGVLAGGETTPPANTAGRVTTDTIPGYPDIPWSTLRTYISRYALGNTVGSFIRLFDRLWVGGTYTFNANVNVTSGSWASRVSYAGGSADYSGLEIWVEAVTASTGNQAYNVTYTNEAGATAHTTGAVGIGSATSIKRCWPLPLQLGDSGVQAISNVTGSVASAGTANIMVLRPIVDLSISANGYTLLSWADLGFPEIFNDSALYFLTMAPSGTASGVPFLDLQLANG